MSARHVDDALLTSRVGERSGAAASGAGRLIRLAGVLLPPLLLVGATILLLWAGTASADQSALPRNALLGPALPSLVLTKTVGTANGCASTTVITVTTGTVVRYCFTVRNTGSITIEAHILDDSHLGVGLFAAPTRLSPGASRVFSVTRPANITLTNVATWTARTTGDPPVIVSDTAMARVVVVAPPPVPAILLTKTVGLTSGLCASGKVVSVIKGAPVYFCYTIKNTSNATLRRHTLVDNRLGTLLNSFPQTLTAGMLFSVVRAANPQVSQTNVATWTAWVTGTNGILGSKALDSDSATVTVTPRVINISFAKTVGTDPSICSTTHSVAVIQGFPAYYCYTARNIGNVPLALHSLVDTAFAAPLLDKKPQMLAVGASTFVTVAVTALVTQSTAATWTAWLTSSTSASVSKSDVAALNVTPNPARIALTKTVGVALEGAGANVCPKTSEILVPAGTNVFYCYSVHNLGPLALPRHQLYDDDLGGEILPIGGDGYFGYPLSPGEVLSTADLGFVISKQITQSTTNFAIWQSYINDVVYAQASALATVRVGNATTQVRLTVGPTDGPACPPGQSLEAAPGASYALCLEIRNTGTVSLTQHTISLPALALDTTFTRTVAPGAALTLTRSDLPAIGPLLLMETRAYSVSVSSTANPSGVPFNATAQSAAVVALLGEAQRSWLPAINR